MVTKLWRWLICETLHVMQARHYPVREPWGPWFCGKCGRRV